ncbi:unnamed protein product [Lactuca saligna]|uniref:DUF4216 domain-containing protein n=1 Tax=Lactuca saligna TaxID=75948 RepID=A0AA35Z2W3_LACSI|nr:unnamed protein product [Lactuca saligna]
MLHFQDLFDMKCCIVQTMCKLEQIYPPSFFDSMEHLDIHLADEAIFGGPVHYRWMYQYKRKLDIIKRRINNKARFEGSIVNEHLVNELATYCSLYFDPTIETHHNREARNFAPQSHKFSSGRAPLSIFVVPSRRLYEKSGKRKPLSDKFLHTAHIYILLNCKEVNPYIIKFDEMVMRTNPNESVSNLRDKYFAEWYEDRTPDGSARHLEVIATKPSRHAYFHNEYFVNGYKVHTQQYGEGRTTNNFGVCVRGETYNAEQESDYYDILEEILEIEYYSSGPSTLVLFNCIWFDNKDGVIVNKNKLVDVKTKSRLQTDDPFCLASQAEQVFYTPYPSMTNETKDKWAVIKTRPRGVFEVTEAEMEANEVFQVEERFESPLTVTRVEPLCLASTINTYEQTSDEESEIIEGEDKEVEDFEDGGDESEFYYSEEEFEDEDDGMSGNGRKDKSHNTNTSSSSAGNRRGGGLSPNSTDKPRFRTSLMPIDMPIVIEVAGSNSQRAINEQTEMADPLAYLAGILRHQA